MVTGRTRRLWWPLLAAVGVFALAVLVIVANYMGVFGVFRQGLLTAGMVLLAVSAVGGIIGLVLALTVRR